MKWLPVTRQDEIGLESKENSIRLLVMGEPGVGKTSLAHLLSHNQPCTKQPRKTYSPTTQVKEHIFRGGRNYWIEFLDLGFPKHPETNTAFFEKVDAVILVFDATKPWTFESLEKYIDVSFY